MRQLSVSVCDSNMKELAILCFFICCCVIEVKSIKCFDCNSLHDTNCADPFNNVSSLLAVDCDSKTHSETFDAEASFCRKAVQRGRGKVKVQSRKAFASEMII